MAYDFMNSAMGFGPNAFETEEERRRRLEQEQRPTPVTQTIKTDPVTGRQTMTISGSVEDLSAANPMTPTVTGPVSPDAIRQVESGGRDFDRAGQPLTSPRGAMFGMQVMPETARQPGFGIRPAQAETPEEYNRVGQEYLAAMQRRYPDQPEAAVAAYNMGPGAVDRNIAQNQGRFNLGQAPTETQNYVPRVMSMAERALSTIIPSAQAATPTSAPAPAQAPARITAPGTVVNLANSAGPAVPIQPPAANVAPTMTAATTAPAVAPVTTPAPVTTTPPGVEMGPPTSAMTDQGWATRFISAQNNPDQMAAIQADPNQPEWLRRLAAEQNFQTVKLQKDEQQAREKVTTALQTGDMLPLAREIQKSGEEGSILKAIMYNSLGLTDLARTEQQKIAGGSWSTAISQDGTTTAMIRYDSRGLPVKGYDQTGRELTTEQLATFGAGGAGGRQLDIVGGTYINDQTGEVGRVVTDKRTGQSFVQTSTGLKAMTGFRPQSSAGSLADQRSRLVQEMNIKLQGKTEEEKMAITRDYNSRLVGQGFPPIQPYEVNLAAPQIAGGPSATPSAPGAVPGPVAPTATAPTTPAVTAPVAPTTPAVTTTPAAPTTTPTQTSGGPRPTLTQLESQQTASKKEAEVTAEDRAKIRNNFGQIKENVDTIENLGRELVTHPGFSVSVGASVQPGFQLIPGTDKASFYSRFDEIKGKQFLAAIENLKGTGAISDAEGKAATAAVSRMSLSQNEQEFRKAQHEFTSMMKRYADRAAKKIGEAPLYNEKTMSEQAKENREAKLWLKKNPRDPDAAAVREKLRERGEL